MGATVPEIDPGALERLTARFGDEVGAWLEELPNLLTELARRWRLELGAAIPRGSVSTVFRRRTSSGRRALLKASPDRPRDLTPAATSIRGAHT